MGHEPQQSSPLLGRRKAAGARARDGFTTNCRKTPKSAAGVIAKVACLLAHYFSGKVELPRPNSIVLS